VEKQLNLIARGEVEFQAVLAYVLDIFTKKFHYFVAKIEKMNALFEATFLSLEESAGRILSRCGRCTRNMKCSSWVTFFQIRFPRDALVRLS
jgi:DNA topoisomerase-3